MDCSCSCLMLPVSWKRKKCNNGRRPRYEVLRKDEFDEEYSEIVSVIVGKEKRMFVVEASILEEKPFRVLMETTDSYFRSEERAIFVNHVDAILFEHMLWLFHNNDFSSSSKFSWKDIIEFYSEPES
ncbi:hypothetical protein QN277_003394 [Acacia crassicarpa]|uniref:Uncharacterized protein n=1 Tax=Acacia crassicarpa TaxID=499986 RepID=A0AAE1J0K1_9FABA|nr:hypothetical protein QN277_003394 [Acacia crassicarpa]